ncbi:NAD(P)/FAD-dependent oxidoreductase [Kocuria sp. M4R2S49]|uniref:NAD(P)/FAD-dependent oxidoreductase n=1 Tax=Kocuria rhizosphaericola TaxID=3376284 RepID=UPI00378ECE98
MNENYDVVVVGGGPAGLAGALCLVRARRTVLVVDAGAPRNDPAEHMHNYLGRDGDAPGALLADGRAEITGYGADVVDGTVVSARATGEGGCDARFDLTLEDGRSVRARRVLITTGLTDELPDVPGLAQRWGRDVIHCPYCHGWEWRDEPLTVLGTGPTAVQQAQLFRQWSHDITLVQHTAPDPDDDERAQLSALGIACVSGEASGVEVVDDRIAGLRLVSGDLVPCRAVVVVPRFAVSSRLIDSLALSTAQEEEKGHAVGSYVPSAPTGGTDVPGVYVAGNVTDLHAQVLAAAAAGLKTGTAVNTDLLAEDLDRALAGHGRT